MFIPLIPIRWLGTLIERALDKILGPPVPRGRAYPSSYDY